MIACRASSQIEADRIQFHGRVPTVQMQPLLRMSGIEGLPVALLEAMAAGVVPVVLSIESGIPELVQAMDHTSATNGGWS